MGCYSIFKDFIFLQGNDETAIRLGYIEYSRTFSFQNQIHSLDSVKEQLIAKTMILGGNAIIDFQFGLKHYPNKNDIGWYASGVSAIIPEERKQLILSAINKSNKNNNDFNNNILKKWIS